MNFEIVYLIWAVIVTVLLTVLGFLIIKLRQKHDSDIQKIKKQTVIDQSKSKTLGRSEIRGELNQILGSYSLLNQYDNIAFLTSVSKQFPLDLIGLKDDSIDFIEIKSLKTPVTSDKEKLVKRLIEEKKVEYKIIEGNIPKDFKIEERKNKTKSKNKELEQL